MKRALISIYIMIVHVADFLSFKGMRKALVLTAITVACIIGFLSIRGVMPFMAVFGTSMEPVLHAGDLILIENVQTSEVQEGDVIVFTIPSAVREHYNYPAVVAHRVIEVRTKPGTTFRTKGDNTGEDPFTVRPQDIMGLVSKQISYVGFPLLFFQSQQGTAFIAIALLLLAFYLYTDEITQGRQRIHHLIFSPVIQANQSNNQVIETRMEHTEKGIEQTQQALSSFAEAMTEYAKHLQSHTSAIQGLSEASHELKRGAAEQNRVLIRLLDTMEQAGPEKKEITPEIKEGQFPPGCIRNRPRGEQK